MRVLMLNPYLPPPAGGIEKEMLALCRELARLGHEPQLLVTSAAFPAGHNPAPEGLPQGVAVQRLDGYLRGTLHGFNPSRAPLLVPGLGRSARAAGADLVLCFNVGWPLALRPAIGALGGRVPILYRTYFHPPGGRLRRAKERLLIGTVARADRALAATRHERELLAAAGLDADRVAVIPPGVELHPDDPALVAAVRREQRLEGKVVVAHVGRLSEFKGTGHLIDGLPAVRARTGQDVVLLLIGPNHMGSELERRIERAQAGEHVRLVGQVLDDRRLRAYLRAADVFALPSEYEAYGIAYLEALAEGVPAIGCRVGGVAEAIADGGLLVAGFGQPEPLVETLCRLVGDRDLRRELGERGRRRVREGLTWRHTALGILALGDEVRGR